jgi:hypothetical protein
MGSYIAMRLFLMIRLGEKFILFLLVYFRIYLENQYRHDNRGPKFCVDNSSQTTRPIESSVQSPITLKIDLHDLINA